MSERNWKDVVRDIKDGNPQVDSFELSESWKNMPRRTEGIANKTNGLYRRSTLNPVPKKNLYNFIIEKQPKTTLNVQTESNSTNEAATAKQSQKTLVPIVQPIVDDADSLNFTQFIGGESDGLKAVTSTPYPLRQIYINKSPKSKTSDVQRKAADSPKKQFLLVPTRIPISTPRTSRTPSNSEQSVPYKQRNVINKNLMSSPILSSTVHNSEDGGEPKSDPVKSVQNLQTSPTSVDADGNFVPFDEVQQEQGACAKPSGEELFRRPHMVPQLSQKQNKLDQDNGIGDDQPETSTQSAKSQRNKKSKQKIDKLLDSYIKVGELISNKTNGVPSDNSTSSSRKRLYQKGDSGIEDQLEHNCDINPVKANENEEFSINKPVANVSKSDFQTGSDQNVDTVIGPPKRASDFQTEEALLQKLSGSVPQSKHNNTVVNLTISDESYTEEQRSSSKKATVLLNNVENQHTSSHKQDGDNAKDRSNMNSICQRNPRSEKHSSKQVLEEIMEDWSDKQNDDEGDRSDSEQPILHNIKKQPPKESRVRQVRSKNQKTQQVNLTSSQNTRSKMEHVDEEVAPEDDELLENRLSPRVRANSQSPVASVAKKTATVVKEKVSKKAKIKSHRLNQQHEDVEYDSPASNENERIIEEPSGSLHTKIQRPNLRQNGVRPRGRPRKQDGVRPRGRPRKQDAESEVNGAEQENVEGNKMQKVRKLKRGPQQNQPSENEADTDVVENVEENEPPKKGRLQKEVVDSEGNKEGDVEGNKMQKASKVRRVPARKQRIESETVGNEVESPTNSEVKTKNKLSIIEEDVPETNADDEPPIEIDRNTVQRQTVDNANQMKTKSRQSRKRKQEDESEVTGNNVTVSKKRKKMNKWEKNSIQIYNSSKSREAVSGTRHSTRERRKPDLVMPLLKILQNQSTHSTQENIGPKKNTSTLRTTQGNVAPRKRRIQNVEGESENVYSMLLNGTDDSDQPLITRLRSIEITQGFHKTVKNNLTIHHVPGETGPSYGYFTLEPGTEKRSCRITWNLHLHVVCGPVVIITDFKESQEMVTGSFASLHSGTKYGLRNDGEKSVLIFFSQHWPKN